jgi:hypothetical protein
MSRLAKSRASINYKINHTTPSICAGEECSLTEAASSSPES